MSCQQILQEDPYIFTDTISNSTSFLHENNSQTKYVPLNRQTIYSRQFRQHEPSITSDTKSSNISDQKIVISPVALKEKNNGTLNGNVYSDSSARTSPKFFKSYQHTHQANNKTSKSDGQNVINLSNGSNSTVKNYHSIASSHSVSKRQVKQENDFELSHVDETDSNGINTGIKEEPSVDSEDTDEKSVKNAKKLSCSKKKAKLASLKYFHHAKSQNVIVEIISDVPTPQVQPDVIDKCLLQKNYYDDNCKLLTRDDRLNMRKIQMRHVLNQYEGIHKYQRDSTDRSRVQLRRAYKLYKKMDYLKEEMFKKAIKICNTRDCSDEAIAMSNSCIKHILSAEKEQFLIRQCCFLHSNGQQCRVPVYDIMATVAVCNDHLNAPAHQLTSDSTKPKKPQVQRKRTKNPLIRPLKKNGKAGRKKKGTALAQSNMLIPAHRPTMIIHPSDIHKQPIKSTVTTLPVKQQESVLHESNQFIHQNSGNLFASSQSSYGSMSSGNEDLYLKQDLMTAVCENSYESSEDTGVGGLSENELISHDVIGSFDMESCAELSKVLSSLPTNTLDDILTEPLHPTREEEEYLDRAIEEVSATGMEQIAITAFEHLEGLDMLEMLDDDEQRQMISAATNLISMSGFLSSHDQDNYSAMPSPMMS